MINHLMLIVKFSIILKINFILKITRRVLGIRKLLIAQY